MFGAAHRNIVAERVCAVLDDVIVGVWHLLEAHLSAVVQRSNRKFDRVEQAVVASVNTPVIVIGTRCQ